MPVPKRCTALALTVAAGLAVPATSPAGVQHSTGSVTLTYLSGAPGNPAVGTVTITRRRRPA